MTVCIAAACEGGKKCVTATDGLLSYGGITADLPMAKMVWKGEWLFLYAGNPAVAAMILAEIDEMQAADPNALERRYVQATVRDAFSRFISRTACRSVLSQYDLTLEQFKDCGRSLFGDQRFTEMCNYIDTACEEFPDQLIVVGWGAAPASLMLYEVDAFREFDHKVEGVSAIGSGSEVALSNLFLLGQSRNSTLSQTLYNVAAAKFASENSQGLSVGRNIVMHVSWKQTEDSEAETSCCPTK